MSKSPDFMANKATSAPAPAGRLRERERHGQWPSSGRAARLRCVDLAAYVSESFSICRSTIWNTRTNASVPMPTPTHTPCCTHVPCCQKLARLHSMHLAASGAAGDDRAARPRVPQAAARLAPRGLREVNGKEHVRAQREHQPANSDAPVALRRSRPAAPRRRTSPRARSFGRRSTRCPATRSSSR